MAYAKIPVMGSTKIIVTAIAKLLPAMIGLIELTVLVRKFKGGNQKVRGKCAPFDRQALEYTEASCCITNTGSTVIYLIASHAD